MCDIKNLREKDLFWVLVSEFITWFHQFWAHGEAKNHGSRRIRQRGLASWLTGSRESEKQ